MQELIQTEKCSAKNAELVLQNKLNSKINKEEMWLTIEAPLKSYLEKKFESKLINKYTVKKKNDMCNILQKLIQKN